MERRSSTRLRKTTCTTPNPPRVTTAPSVKRMAASTRKLTISIRHPIKPIDKIKGIKEEKKAQLENYEASIPLDVDGDNRLAEASRNSDIIYVTGPSSTGKTTVVKEFLSKNAKYYVYIDCSSLVTPTQLYSDILNSLVEPKGSISSHGSQNFVHALRQLLKEREIQKFYIALDNAHRIKNTLLVDCIALLIQLEYMNLAKQPVDSDATPSFCIVQMILITSESLTAFANFFPTIFIKNKIVKLSQVISINPWSKKDLIERISACEPNIRPDLYKTMVNNIVNTHYNGKTKDYLELKNICEAAFERFIEQYKDEDEIESTFRTCDKFLRALKEPEDLNRINNAIVIDMLVLITSAYIASCTRPKDDKINFVKRTVKSRRRKVEPSDFCTQGTRPFTLERLLQIYRQLRSNNMHERLDNPSREDLLDSAIANVKTLVDLNFLRTVGDDGLSSLNKYALSESVDYKYAKLMANGCGLNLDDYLA